MADGVVRDKAQADQERDGDGEAGGRGPLGTIAVAHPAYDRGDEARDEDAEEDQACCCR